MAKKAATAKVDEVKSKGTNANASKSSGTKSSDTKSTGTKSTRAKTTGKATSSTTTENMTVSKSAKAIVAELEAPRSAKPDVAKDRAGKATTGKATASKAPALLTLTDIGDHLASTFDMPKSHAKIYLAEAVALIGKTLKKGNKVRISGLGVFQVKKRAARKGRNPTTGESIKIKASKRVGFAVARNLKARL